MYKAMAADLMTHQCVSQDPFPAHADAARSKVTTDLDGTITLDATNSTETCFWRGRDTTYVHTEYLCEIPRVFLARRKRAELLRFL